MMPKGLSRIPSEMGPSSNRRPQTPPLPTGVICFPPCFSPPSRYIHGPANGANIAN